ncbi:MAG: disk-shape morphogenesis protein volactin [Planctomycetota bacterium]|jgi:hypothetical protein
MTVALDLGASHFRTLRRVDDRLVARSAQSIYAVLADTSAHRRLLDQASVCYSLSEGNIVLLGDAAADSGTLFRVPCRRLLSGGRVPNNDPLARQLISTLIEAVLPTASSGQPVCCLALPSSLKLEAGSSHADFEFYSRIVRLQGYSPKLVPASQALVLAELLAASFTGIGLVFGASGCEAVLAHRGQMLCHVQTEFAGNEIDQRLLQHGFVESAEKSNGPDSDAIIDAIVTQRFRESLTPNMSSPGSDADRVVADILRRSCEKLIAALDAEIRRTPRATSVPQPLAVVCAGGLSRMAGFEDLIHEVLSECRPAVGCESPRIASVSARSILRGLLVSAELESPRDAEAA